MLFVLTLASTPALAAPDSLPVALEMARRALVVHDEAAAGEALRGAEDAAGASSLLVPPKELARLHYYAGVRAWRGGLASQGMEAWRRMWRVGGWDPEDDGLLDDEGMAVLRALRSEGGVGDSSLDLVGDARGVLVLVDGSRFASKGMLYEGVHLLQVRCPDGAVSSSWTKVAGNEAVPLGCGQHQVKKGVTGANAALLAEGVDEDLAQLALFGAYSADSTLRLVGLPPAPEPAVKASPAMLHVATVPAEADPSDTGADDWGCDGESLFQGSLGAPMEGWSGSLRVTSADGGARVWQAGSLVFPEASGDVRVRLEGEGAFGVRVRGSEDGAVGWAVHFEGGALNLVQLPNTPVVGRDVPAGGRHELEVSVRGTRVTARLDGALFLGGAVGPDTGGVAGIEAEAGAWLGRVAVCR
ncbi:hypothetical protein LBMAG42_45070 [Deltaproteobacteria bacterium]|nr:hypothetical protein LBMAG42_45070 [Deltaproteobacteria bacterium]